jgi:Subtilisin-like serine proteases
LNYCEYEITSNDYADFIMPNNVDLSRIEEANEIVCTTEVDTIYSILYTIRSGRSDFMRFPYATVPSLYTLLDISSMVASGVTQTLVQPFLNSRGQGTMIGFIDTGIDYMNPLFLNTDGTTRILGIWDQTLTGGTATNTFVNYGREFTKEEIDNALKSENPLDVVPSEDRHGHGTFNAGIAAGNEAPEREFSGAAPDCSICVVKLKPAKQYLRELYCIQDDAVAYQENDILIAIRYLMNLATEYGMPLVIYIGVGTNYGSHEGTSPLGITLRRINHMAGVTTVVPAGNETGLGSHYEGNFTQNQSFEDVELRVGGNENGLVIQLWAAPPETYSVGFISPLGRVIERVPVNYQTATVINFILEDTEIVVYYGISEFGSGSSYVYMRFKNPTPGIWKIRVFNRLSVSGRYHMWIPIDGFITNNTYFINSNPNTIVTEPGNASEAITVGVFNHLNNSLYFRSSRGYNRVGVVKPDLVAPGVGIVGPGLRPSYSNDVFPMTSQTGASVAAAHVAGAVAILMTWGIVNRNRMNMTTATIKSILIRGADRNPAIEYPNREWGYGTINLYQSFLRLTD